MILVLVLAVLPPVSWGEPLYQHPRLPGQQPAQEDEDRAKIEKDMAKKANQQRQADLKRDTDKLLKLATELQQYVDNPNRRLSQRFSQIQERLPENRRRKSASGS